MCNKGLTMSREMNIKSNKELLTGVSRLHCIALLFVFLLFYAFISSQTDVYSFIPYSNYDTPREALQFFAHITGASWTTQHLAVIFTF